jgi:hypothetical protein
MNAPDQLPSVDEQLLCRAITLADRSHWKSNATAAAALREEALERWAAAHQARRDAMYARGTRQ